MAGGRESGGGGSPLTVKHSPSVFSARLIAVTGGELGRAYSVGPEGASIGRDADATIQLAREDISRKHARIYLAGDGRWFVEDLKSSNGTLVNGVIIRRTELEFGDRIQVGEKLLFIFTRHDDLGDKVLELQKMEAIGQLAGGVAHDFQNLLAVISNNLAFMKEGLAESPPPEALLESLDEAQLAVKRAVDLTRQLLTFARGKGQQQQKVDLSLLATEVLQMCRRTFGEAIKFQSTIAPCQEVMGDRSQLHQVVMNLCLNARDAMPDGGTLTLTLEPEVPTARAHTVPPLIRSGVCVGLTVTDTGCGMDEQTRGRVFEPFFSTKGPEQGTGLGLATCYSIIKQHGGDVEVNSRPGQGATFRVLLPRPEAPLTHPTQEPKSMKPTAAIAAVTADARDGVLVVDADQAALSKTIDLLKGWNYETFTAENGREAVLVFERNKRQVGAVILDLDLPVLGSKDTFRILRTVHPSARIILTAGQMESSLATELLTKGAEGFLPKPVPAEPLKEMLDLIFSPEEDEGCWEDLTLQRDGPRR